MSDREKRKLRKLVSKLDKVVYLPLPSHEYLTGKLENLFTSLENGEVFGDISFGPITLTYHMNDIKTMV